MGNLFWDVWIIWPLGNFAPSNRGLHEIAAEILTVPLDREPRRKGARRTSFATCLEDDIHCYRHFLDSSGQLKQFGCADYIDRAEALLPLLREIASGKTGFSHEEIGVLQGSLTVVSGAVRSWTQDYMRELDECRHPERSISNWFGTKDHTEIRDGASEGYYISKFIADSIEKKIPPLFQELAQKLHISLNAPQIQ